MESGTDAVQLGAGLPRRLERLLRAAEAGDAQVRVTSDDVLALGAHIKRAGNTIAIALLAAAAIRPARPCSPPVGAVLVGGVSAPPDRLILPELDRRAGIGGAAPSLRVRGRSRTTPRRSPRQAGGHAR